MNIGNRHSQHSFAQVPSVNMARSAFNRSYAIKDTFDFDYLTPLFVEEILPGDTMNLNVKCFARLATQVVPVMDNMYLDFFFFFVPNRLVWNNWERFNGAQDDPGDSTDFLIPTITSPVTTGFTVGSTFDHWGIPTGVPGFTVSALPFRAMNLVWNEWFRDQNLQDSIVISKGDGPDLASAYPLLKRAKKHDYFTSCLPNPQKGPAVTMPLGSTAPITGLAVTPVQNINVYRGTGTSIGGAFSSASTATGPIGVNITSGAVPANNNITLATVPTNIVTSGLEADLTDATAATINQFRQAIMMQSLLELDARGGTRYVEIIKAHFNVISPDFRLQRPEFLSGGTIPISQHPVAQTSETGTSPQANLAAYSTAAEFGNRIGFSKSFVEHGYVLGFVQARADVTYQQGLNKLWSRRTRWDFFWPKFQELGEQAVLRREIYTDGTANDDIVFGYQERFAEMRYHPSEIRGQFRSTFAETLDVWHLAEEFGSAPTLGNTFIQSNTPIARVLEVPDEDYPDLLLDGFFELKHARPMVTYGVPASLGRF
ncbi:MAG: major capsid protein [Microviridae sp.]|nr:MAG: major capsid protein [Microviridae sp.]